MTEAKRVHEAILFTDIVGSVSLGQTVGPQEYSGILARHGELFNEALRPIPSTGIEPNAGDGFLARFVGPTDAVAAALRFQSLLRNEHWAAHRKLEVRIGIHLGEFLLLTNTKHMAGMVGTPVNLAARIMAMAEGGQVLMTHAVFENARQFLKEIPGISPEAQAPLGWVAHGPYLLKGIEEPVEVFEVGEQGRSPFMRSHSGSWGERVVSRDEEMTLGWRPAIGLEVPRRAGWFLQRKVGEGGFGEVWLAERAKTQETRVFKFCFDAARLRSLKRELVLFQLISKALGQRRDIARLFEVQLEKPPFFLESEYCPQGILSEWISRKRAEGGTPVAVRLHIIADVARALAAAHSLGIIHKDVKPSNIFIEEHNGSYGQARLADFGIGVLTDQSALQEFEITNSVDWTQGLTSSQTGTRLYAAPEYMIGAPPSVQGDIYSLGVVLYQLVVDDFQRPVGEGWQRDIADPLLREDIAQCVDVAPERRFGSALHLAERIEALEKRRAAAAAAEAAAVRQADQHRRLRLQQRRMRLAAGTSVVALVLFGAMSVVAWLFNKERQLSEDRLYVADMTAAAYDAATRRAGAARELLERHRPSHGAFDRRGWEWFYADSALNSEHLVRQVSPRPLRALAVSLDERLAAIASDDGFVSVWSCAKIERLHTVPLGVAPRCLSFKRELLAIGTDSGEIMLYEAGVGRVEKRWTGHSGAVTALDWHPVSGELVSGGADGFVSWWTASGELVRRVRKDGPVEKLAWRSDGSELASIVDKPRRLLLENGETFETTAQADLGNAPSPLAWRPGYREVAIAMDRLPLRSWRPETGESSLSLPSYFCTAASCYAWAPDGASIAVGDVDGKIVFVKAERQTESRRLYGHRGAVSSISWLGGSNRILSVGEDGTLRAWDNVWQPPEIKNLIFSTGVADAQWNPISNQVAVLLTNAQVELWSGDTWLARWSRSLPATSVESANARGELAWSPDGKWIAAMCPDRPPAAWQIESGETTVAEGILDALAVQWSADNRAFLVGTPSGWWSVTVPGGAKTRIAGSEAAAWIGDLAGGARAMVLKTMPQARFVSVENTAAEPKLSVELPRAVGEIRRCVLSPDRQLLAMAGDLGAVVWIETRTGKLHRPPVAHAGPVIGVAWSPDQSRLASVGIDGTCWIYHVPQVAGTWLIEHNLKGDVRSASWSSDGRRLSLASEGYKFVKTYDASTSYKRHHVNPAVYHSN